MATFMKIDDRYIDLDNVTSMEFDQDTGRFTIWFVGGQMTTLPAVESARLAAWLERHTAAQWVFRAGVYEL